MTDQVDESEEQVGGEAVSADTSLDEPTDGRSGWARFRRVTVIVLIFAFLGLLADAIYVAVALGSGLTRAESSLSEARTMLEQANWNDAGRALREAEQSSGRAASATSHPAYLVATNIPGIADDVATIGAIGRAAHYSAQAGIAVTDAIGDTSEGGSLFRAIYPRGTIDFDVTDRLAPGIARAASLVGQANEVLDRNLHPHLRFLSDTLAEARQRISDAASATRRGSSLFAVLPELLGRDDARRYLLAFLSPSEARGSGGLMGLYGVLRVERGRIHLDRVGPVSDLIVRGRLRIEGMPGWFRDTYGPLGSLNEYQQADLTPNFPAAAEAWLRMYRESTGAALDGVIAMDPIALQALMAATAPITIAGSDTSIGEDNAARVLLYDSYLQLDTVQQTAFLGAVIGEFWARVRDGDINARKFVTGLAESAGSQHLKVYSTSETVQEGLVGARIAGDYESYGPNVQLVFNNNEGLNKVDYFLRRSIETRVELAANDSARVVTKVTLTNDTPREALSAELFNPGTRGAGGPGANAMAVHFILPDGARWSKFLVEGDAITPIEGTDGSRPMVFYSLIVPRGASRTFTVRYDVPHAVDGDTLQFVLVPQSAVRTERYEVSFRAPPGQELFDTARMSGGPSITYDGRLRAPVEFDLRLLDQG